MFSWTAFALTIIFGPLVFAVWSRLIDRQKTIRRWPVGAADSIGDLLVLPLFNGFAFGMGLSVSVVYGGISLIAAFAIAIIYYRMSSTSQVVDWSTGSRGRYNAGGWYHFTFLFIETGLIAYALLSHPGSWVLWALFGAFLVSLVYFVFVQLPKRN